MMPRKRKRRLIAVSIMVTGISIAVIITLIALNQNINVFYSPSQIVNGEAPENTYFRIGGMVVSDSVMRDVTDLGIRFKLTDTAEQVEVRFQGILPDLFREGQGIVAQGKLNNQVFIADEVLAKHDENYMPPEVSDALKIANKTKYAKTQSGSQ